MSTEPSPDDSHLAEVLDKYLDEIQSGSRPDRDALLRQHPGLASLLECMEALDRLAPGDTLSSKSGEPTEAGPRAPVDFGQYELLGEIGRGGMGVVYQARQKALDRVVALKMILSSHLASAEHVRRFQAEARAAARLQHPHVVQIHEVGQVHGQHYFTMEYVQGESLSQRLARGPMAFEWSVRVLAAVARAVDYLHRQGVVHRDLKPSNILLDAEEEPYVTDFGLAKLFVPGSEVTATGVIVGTPSYMAPEQASGHGAEIGPGSDVYSLGAILYEMLTGRPVFREENPLDTLLDVLGSEPVAPRLVNPKVPAPLEWICLKCLAKSPADRYLTAADLADDLERFMRGEVLAVRPPHWGQRALRWTRRQPALASHLGALSMFYAIEWINFLLGNVDRDFHVKISILIGLWMVVSIVGQQLLESRRWALASQFAWGTLDALLFLAVVLVGNGAASALVVGYPLLIVGSGLWFRVRFVWYMTALSLCSYAILVMDFYVYRPELQASFDARYDRHAIFVMGLVVIGAIVSYLVRRLRALSAFCGRHI